MKAPEGWRTPKASPLQTRVRTSVRFWTAAVLCRFGFDLRPPTVCTLGDIWLPMPKRQRTGALQKLRHLRRASEHPQVLDCGNPLPLWLRLSTTDCVHIGRRLAAMPKRQRAGALQKLRHLRRASEHPSGFGLRQSSAALASTFDHRPCAYRARSGCLCQSARGLAHSKSFASLRAHEPPPGFGDGSRAPKPLAFQGRFC